MKHVNVRSAVAWFLSVILFGLTTWFTGTDALADDSSLLGSKDFRPTPENPVGFRGDQTGCFPGAYPPVSWSERGGTDST